MISLGKSGGHLKQKVDHRETKRRARGLSQKRREKKEEEEEKQEKKKEGEMERQKK